MEEGFNNANNPFGVTNGSTTDNIIAPTDGLLLNLSDKLKQNGTDLSPSDDFFEKSNGKRSASEFDDEDFGPETDVDTVDDFPSPGLKDEVAKSFADCFPSPNNNPLVDEGVFNPFMEHQEKAALEMEKNMRKRETNDEFDDDELMAREETPTPPADVVHDVSGLVENPGDSESEDEWNYIKGEEANKENISPQPEKEVADIPEEDDTMSQLNPNAAEFVPVSPTRSIPSPACRMLINDPIVSQSPKKANEVDINLPNPKDFENEVKSRPSEVGAYNNGHKDDDDHDTSKDLMENILNGKNIDEIPEFQPGSTPKKVFQNDEFHFGPNAAPFSPKLLDQSEALSTKALFGDESEATVDISFNESANRDLNILNKESDPMSMSFYGDKGDNNPFDLNKVQQLPDNLDDFLKQPDNETFNETISDLPEHNPLGELKNNDDAIQITDLDKQAYDDEKELASPLEPEKELLNTEEADLSKTPEPTSECLLEEFCKLPENQKLIINVPEDLSEVSDLLRSDPENLPPDVELLPNFDLPPSEPLKLSDPSVEITNLPVEPKPVFEKESLEECDIPSNRVVCKLPSELFEGLQDPESVVCDNSGNPDLISISQSLPEQPQAVSPLCDRPESMSSACDLSESKSPMPEEPMSAGSEDYTRPEFIQEAQDRFEELCKPLESPQEEVTSSVKDDLSQEHEDVINVIPNQNEIIGDSFVQEDVEKKQLENLEEIPPSISPIDNLVMLQAPPPKMCVYPIKTIEKEEYIPFDVKTENILPEFAEPTIVTPLEESRTEEMIIGKFEPVCNYRFSSIKECAEDYLIDNTTTSKCPKPQFVHISPSTTSTDKQLAKSSLSKQTQCIIPSYEPISPKSPLSIFPKIRLACTSDDLITSTQNISTLNTNVQASENVDEDNYLSDYYYIFSNHSQSLKQEDTCAALQISEDLESFQSTIAPCELTSTEYIQSKETGTDEATSIEDAQSRGTGSLFSYCSVLTEPISRESIKRKETRFQFSVGLGIDEATSIEDAQSKGTGSLFSYCSIPTEPISRESIRRKETRCQFLVVSGTDEANSIEDAQSKETRSLFSDGSGSTEPTSREDIKRNEISCQYSVVLGTEDATSTADGQSKETGSQLSVGSEAPSIEAAQSKETRSLFSDGSRPTEPTSREDIKRIETRCQFLVVSGTDEANSIEDAQSKETRSLFSDGSGPREDIKRNEISCQYSVVLGTEDATSTEDVQSKETGSQFSVVSGTDEATLTEGAQSKEISCQFSVVSIDDIESKESQFSDISGHIESISREDVEKEETSQFTPVSSLNSKEFSNPKEDIKIKESSLQFISVSVSTSKEYIICKETRSQFTIFSSPTSKVGIKSKVVLEPNDSSSREDIEGKGTSPIESYVSDYSLVSQTNSEMLKQLVCATSKTSTNLVSSLSKNVCLIPTCEPKSKEYIKGKDTKSQFSVVSSPIETYYKLKNVDVSDYSLNQELVCATTNVSFLRKEHIKSKESIKLEPIFATSKPSTKLLSSLNKEVDIIITPCELTSKDNITSVDSSKRSSVVSAPLLDNNNSKTTCDHTVDLSTYQDKVEDKYQPVYDYSLIFPIYKLVEDKYQPVFDYSFVNTETSGDQDTCKPISDYSSVPITSEEKVEKITKILTKNEHVGAANEQLSETQKVALELEAEMTAIGVTSTVATGAAITAVLTESKVEEEKKFIEKKQERKSDPLKKTPIRESLLKDRSTSSKSSVKRATSPKSPLKAPTPKTGIIKTTPTRPKTNSNTTPPLKKQPIKSLQKMTNGETKTSAKPLSARKPLETSAKLGVKPTAATATLRGTQNKLTSKPQQITITKTATSRPVPPASARPAPITKRPTTLSKSHSGAIEKASVTAKQLSSLKAKPTTTILPKPATTVPSKPKPTSTVIQPPSKGRLTVTKDKSKTLPDTEKQIKENVNKITASRTVTQRTVSAPVRSTIKSTTAYQKSVVNSARTTVMKSTTATVKSTLSKKKPTDIVKTTAVTKTSPTKIEKPKENGISTVITEEITAVNKATVDQKNEINLN